MASKTFSGQLDQAMNEAAAEGNKILFIPQQTVGEVLPGAASELMVESDGTYSIKLAYNTYSIYHYSDVTKRKTLLATDIVVSTDTAVTTIPDLLGSVVPVTEDSVLTIQGYLDEANDAKTDAEAAQAATEALFDDFDSSVADSMSLVHTDTPSLSIPFNESGRLDYGVGTEYVAGLPVYGVDFTRSTTSTVINKSGVLETLSADEIGIGADGAWLHGAYTNLLTYSVDFSSNWTTTSSDITISSSSSTYAGVDMYEVTDSSTSIQSAIWQSVDVDGATDNYANFSVFVKKGSSDYFGIEFYIFSTSSALTGYSGIYIDTTDFSASTKRGSVKNINVESMADEVYRISFTYELGETDGELRARIYPALGSDGSGTSEIGSTYFGGAQVSLTSSCLPYLPTSTSTATATATSCTVPASGNLPTVSNGFTVISDAYVDNSSSIVNYSRYYLIGSASDYLSITQTHTGVLRVQHSLGGWFTSNAATTNDVSRLVLIYTPDAAAVTSSLSLYQDGELLSSRSYSELLGEINDGSVELGTTINSQIKNFKILPYAASADEVKSWGAPK